MMPNSFIGWGHDQKTGEFFVKGCPHCYDYKALVIWAVPNKTRPFICTNHAQKLIERIVP